MKKFKPIKIAFIFNICIYFFPQKNSLFTSDIHYLWNGIDFENVMLLKLWYILQKNRCLKNLKVEFLRNESDKAILKQIYEMLFKKYPLIS